LPPAQANGASRLRERFLAVKARLQPQRVTRHTISAVAARFERRQIIPASAPDHSQGAHRQIDQPGLQDELPTFPGGVLFEQHLLKDRTHDSSLVGIGAAQIQRQHPQGAELATDRGGQKIGSIPDDIHGHRIVRQGLLAGGQPGGM
jgi:hypothetical protein